MLQAQKKAQLPVLIGLENSKWKILNFLCPSKEIPQPSAESEVGGKKKTFLQEFILVLYWLDRLCLLRIQHRTYKFKAHCWDSRKNCYDRVFGQITLFQEVFNRTIWKKWVFMQMKHQVKRCVFGIYLWKWHLDANFCEIYLRKLQ